jgi:hypothetical protein
MSESHRAFVAIDGVTLTTFWAVFISAKKTLGIEQHFAWY